MILFFNKRIFYFLTKFPFNTTGRAVEIFFQSFSHCIWVIWVSWALRYVRELALYHVFRHSAHHCTRSALPLMVLSDSSSCARLPELEHSLQHFQPCLWLVSKIFACYKYSKRIFYSPTSPQQMMVDYFLFLGQGPRISHSFNGKIWSPTKQERKRV